jgi:hypothetical protein
MGYLEAQSSKAFKEVDKAFLRQFLLYPHLSHPFTQINEAFILFLRLIILYITIAVYLWLSENLDFNRKKKLNWILQRAL